jgi:hypothetical protein
MSTAPAPAPAHPAVPPAAPRREITLISHSMLFYWWPIWLLGFIMAAITYFDNTRLAILPAGAKVTQITSDAEKQQGISVYRVAIPGQPTRSIEKAEEATTTPGDEPAFKPRMSQRPWMAPVFCVVLLMTVVITNVPLRGLWSFLVLLLLVVVALIITVIPGGWDSVLGALFHLHVYINMAGYLFIATAVFILWAVSVFIFDQRTYMIVEPGQIRVCEHVGASIRNIDATGLEFEKQRDDLFRHWLLGFFSGDLIIHMPDKREQIRLPNVLWISWRLEEVQQLLREKATVIRGTTP